MNQDRSTAVLARRAVQDLDRAADPVAAVLVMCEQGLAALVRAVSVLDARDVLAAISILEHAVKVRDLNQQAVIAASTLRIRAERRVGELLADEGRNRARPLGRPQKDSSATRLSDRGITFDESSKFQRLAAVPGPEFDRAIEQVSQDAVAQRKQITREAVMRVLDPTPTPADAWKDGDRFKVACDRVAQLADAAVEAIRWKHFPGREAPDVTITATRLSLRGARDGIARVEAALQKGPRT